MKEEKQMHNNHRNRMKNIFVEHGFEAFTEIQKLEFMLFFAIPQKDVNPIAHNLLSEFGSLPAVLAASFDDLVKVDGVGKHTALLLKTFKEVSKEPPVGENIKLSNSTDMRKYCYNLLKNSNVEEFYVLCLDETGKLLKTKKLATGGATNVTVNIREITKLCITHGATQIVITHNHPSGNSEFSDDDIHLTHSIMCSGLLNDIYLIDHVLVTPKRAYSLAEKGLMSKIEETAISRVNVDQRTISKLHSARAKYVVDKNFNQ